MKIMCMDVYFAAHKEMGKIDSTFKSLHFENIALPDDYEGMPAEICRNLRNQIDEIEKEIENVQKQMNDFLSVKAKKIRGARYKLEELSNNFDVRKWQPVWKMKNRKITTFSVDG